MSVRTVAVKFMDLCSRGKGFYTIENDVVTREEFFYDGAFI